MAVHAAAVRTLPPARARRGLSAWLESEARALHQHFPEHAVDEVEAALKRAGLACLLASTHATTRFRRLGRGFLIGFSAGMGVWLVGLAYLLTHGG